MVNDTKDSKLYSHVEMDFTEFSSMPTPEMLQASLFSASLFPALGDLAFEQASKLTKDSPTEEKLAVKQSLYKQLVTLNLSSALERSASPNEVKQTATEYESGSKEVEEAINAGGDGKGLYTNQKYTAKALAACEEEDYEKLKNIITEYNEELKLLTDKDLPRTSIKIIDNEGVKHTIQALGRVATDTKEAKTDAQKIREAFREHGLTDEDIAYLDHNLNQAIITGNAISVMNLKAKFGEQKSIPVNGDCKEVIIRVGATGMASLEAKAEIHEINKMGEDLPPIKVNTVIDFSSADKSLTNKKVPSSVKVEVEHVDKNAGIKKVPNIPSLNEVATEVASQEKGIIKKVKFYIKKAVTVVRNIAIKIKNIFTGKSSKNTSESESDYLENSFPPTERQPGLESHGVEQEYRALPRQQVEVSSEEAAESKAPQSAADITVSETIEPRPQHALNASAVEEPAPTGSQSQQVEVSSERAAESKAPQSAAKPIAVSETVEPRPQPESKHHKIRDVTNRAIRKPKDDNGIASRNTSPHPRTRSSKDHGR